MVNLVKSLAALDHGYIVQHLTHLQQRDKRAAEWPHLISFFPPSPLPSASPSILCVMDGEWQPRQTLIHSLVIQEIIYSLSSLLNFRFLSPPFSTLFILQSIH